MDDQLLEQAGVGIFRHPEWELLVMGQDEFGQVGGILGIILGAGSRQCLQPTALRAKRIGVKAQPC